MIYIATKSYIVRTILLLLICRERRRCRTVIRQVALISVKRQSVACLTLWRPMLPLWVQL